MSVLTVERTAPQTAAPQARQRDDVTRAGPAIDAAGEGALLFNPASGEFDAVMQRRLQALARRVMAQCEGDATAEVVLGVNNVMFLFDPLRLHPDAATAALLRLWETTEPGPLSDRLIEIPVVYGGEAGEDLITLASALGLEVREYVRRHSDASYEVACIGSMPGFAYMTGLPAEMAVPRRSVPRMKTAAGTVIIGGAQAGVMPCTAPSGWHLLGRTDAQLFDPVRSPPCLMAPGDRVRFTVAGIAS
ncbi:MULTISPECIES: 5-oxoprolinase subunit PxpB [Pandoraea]|uniref:5-oxoprolinase subunit PxpB n=1 Tax=Pandoraea TaxID=93217 RepID=UPI001F5C27B6|nr:MULTISPECIES: 5-oxoprolinase subunit PxpB [Pandoraea]MCI3208729.1 allophanate hydrolase [Pandoraea sp. LA3]MDN4586758.1 allophanate hydrolase [Pandoraea capi]